MTNLALSAMRKTRVDRGSEWTKAALIYTRLNRSITAVTGAYRTSRKATWVVIYIREPVLVSEPY